MCRCNLKRTRLFLSGFLLIAVLIFDCTIDYAGGTGVGNPSGNTTVSIVADTLTTALASGSPADHGSFQNDAHVPIIDEAFVFNASAITIVVQKIFFILDDDQNVDSLVPRYAKRFLFEEGSVILTGPFVFNALTGECDFTFDTVSLPPAKYKGIKLDIANNDSTLMEGYSILLEGTFEYADTVRNFSIKLSNEKDIRPYLMDGPAQHIGENDSTEFRLALNANRWLDYIDLKTDYIDEGTLSFKPGTKALIVDRSVDANVYRDFNKTVRLNIINSGTLAVIFN